MIYQPPAGARDLLPLEVSQKSWINDRLQLVFQQWGYQRIVTSTIEWLDTLTAGEAIERSKVIHLQNTTEGTLGLRPELTASIARAAMTKMADDPPIAKRICYRANVFRNPPAGYHGKQLEFFQAGVELLFAGGLLADAEVILLLADCLSAVGLSNWQFILGEASLTNSLIGSFPAEYGEKIRNCILSLDRVGIENLSLPPNLKEKALKLFDLRGDAKTVLQKVTALDLDKSAQEIVDNLKSLVDLLEKTASIPLILDLTLLETFKYYTGIVFQVIGFENTKPRIIGKGGRYDKLLGFYHPQGKTSPGVGFSFQIEDLYTCLLYCNALPTEIPPSDWLVIPTSSEADSAAFLYAQKLRNSVETVVASGEKKLVRVEIDLQRRSPELLREYAASNGIPNLVWIDADGNPIVESLSI